MEVYESRSVNVRAINRYYGKDQKRLVVKCSGKDILYGN